MEAKNTGKAYELKKRIEMLGFEEIANILKLYESAKGVPAISVRDICIGEKTYSVSFPGSATHDFQINCSDGRTLLIDVIHDSYRFENHISVYIRFLLPKKNFELDFSGLIGSVPLDSEDSDILSEINGKKLASVLRPSYLNTLKSVEDAIELYWNFIPKVEDDTITDKEIFDIILLIRKLFKEVIFTKEELNIIAYVLKDAINKEKTKGKLRTRNIINDGKK